MGVSSFSFDERNLILIFESQILDFNEEFASQLRSTLLGTPSLQWILETVKELPQHWGSISEAFPALQLFPGVKLLEGLNAWLRIGKFPPGSFPLPNILLTPLVVITHLAQYAKFLALLHPDRILQDDLQASFQQKAETLGLCTGLLTSAAISSSENCAQLEKYGAVAIRLALAIGAFVDAKDTGTDTNGKWRSVSVGWKSTEAGDEMVEILKAFPEAFVSVIVEERRVTISTPKNSAARLLSQLKNAGCTVVDIALRGGFHDGRNALEAGSLIQLLNANLAFQLPDASQVVFPTRSNTGEDYFTNGKLHHLVTQSMLTEQSNWHKAFTALQSSASKPDSLVVSFGHEHCVPQWFTRELGPRFLQFTDFDLELGQLPARTSRLVNSIKNDKNSVSNDAVAVVGMSCQLPGADDLEGFWDALCTGKSQHVEVPNDRFHFQTAWRDLEPNRKWYGNFIQGYDAFDHKFFKKSPREMSSTDPQHRLMLQAAYQAIEQSGYFNMPSQDQHIGCYIGVGLVDYENNVACYPATAYTATGNLKSFAAGKISHYFGWTGPSLTIDTACSSSAVAIHQACKAILTGECSAALAGGVNIMTSPEWFQNLAGASFLSPTGQCKPFDINADGYCRGEGVGAVFLKKLSAATEEGDQILGVIAASGVYQNQNCTAITVPNALSLCDLFYNVTYRAGLEPEQISVVEAHGTGTQVGDPAEYDSVSRVFGGLARAHPLSLGSVKGLLGHTESASGIVALIKVLLMIIKGAIPPQASFQTINPQIHASPSDNIEIATEMKPWDVDFRAVLINNYGASGSNASLVVTEAPSSNINYMSVTSSLPLSSKYPFWLCGLDDQSLRTYSAKLVQFLKSNSTPSHHLSLANLSFQLSRQSNKSLGQALIFSCGSVRELEEKLTAFTSREKSVSSTSLQQSGRPVILCFGGQISTFVGLDRQTYESFRLLRSHLDQCDSVCLSQGLESIYPEIFQRTPVSDIVKLQTMLFAIQYSCAKSWIDSGVKVAAVVGHSFGELTAMCVSGALSLNDTLKMIAGRARIIKERWGPEKGSMMVVEADLENVEKVLAATDTGVTIACYNGPKNFTLAGSVKAIEKVMNTVVKENAYSFIKTKKLDVTNAFHSTLVEPLMPDLEKLGEDLIFRPPVVPLERATKDRNTAMLDQRFVANHMRSPVYFDHAVQRLSQQYPSCVWLEAGSNSTITHMVSRALGSPKSSYFQSINLTGDSAFQSLADATSNLWKEGLSISFWAHHPIQLSEYSPLLLPPYQFEKSKHWMELKKPQKALGEPPAQAQFMEEPKGLWTFVGYQDTTKTNVRFRVNTMTEKYRNYVSAHVVAQSSPICPSTFQFVIATDALMNLVVESHKSNLRPELREMDSHAPMCMDESKFVWLSAVRSRDDSLVWDWKMTSTNKESPASEATLHVSGRIAFRNADDSAYVNDFARYERLVARQRCLALLDGNEADGVIKGRRNIYKAFADIVQYKDEVYKGLEKIAGKDNQSAGYIFKEHKGETFLDLGLADTFCQVAGIYLNSIMDHSDDDMYISDRIDQWIPSPSISIDSRPREWEVFACHHHPSDKECISDVFVFDRATGSMMGVIMGIHYVKVSKVGMGRLLNRLSASSKAAQPAPPSAPIEIPLVNGFGHSHSQDVADPVPQHLPQKEKSAKQEHLKLDIFGSVRDLLCNLSGLEADDIKLDSDLVELGIDSLMGMELAREVESIFKISLEMSDLLDLTDLQSLITCIQANMGLPDDLTSDVEDDERGKSVDDKPITNGVMPRVNHVAEHVNGTVPEVNGDYFNTNGDTVSSTRERSIPAAVILETFAETQRATDRFIEENKLSNYAHRVLPSLNELCIIHIVDGFEHLGCSLRTAKPGQSLERIQTLPRHRQVVDILYEMLEQARLVDLDGRRITRTGTAVPKKSADMLLQELIHNHPDHAYDYRLTYLVGCQLADCLTGQVDGLQLIFASAEGREVVSGMYGKSPINVAWIKQMESFLTHFFRKLPQSKDPIKILEMGAGTGGTTARLVPLLAGLGVPFEYTVTDLSPSLVAAARKNFKEYPLMQFKVLNIEKPPPAELIHSQHLVIATNCVHATHSLTKSTKNIHDLLRADGFLMMLEMTETIPWIDLVFGLLEGWWLFDDGRRHALAPLAVWEKTMQTNGYGHVDWTEGNLPESSIQRIIIALASGPSYNRVLTSQKPSPNHATDFAARQVVVDSLIERYTRDFSVPVLSNRSDAPINPVRCVLVTGATGSLGSHLVAYFASQSSIQNVVCLNRHSSVECATRQRRSFESRGIVLDPGAMSKVKVLETDTSKPLLGLTSAEYAGLVGSVSHIVHNAWPMSITRPVHAFEAQFTTMRNLIDLARECSRGRRQSNHSRIGFQFISSIATVGCHPLVSGDALVPEEKMGVASVMPTGYGDAKLICERMLDETLHRFPDDFRPMVVRIGQIAGSRTSGHWNPVEHLAFLIKSSQTLRVLPELQGTLSWCPVNDVAATLGDLLLCSAPPYPIYHIENPARQPWPAMIQMLAESLGATIVSFDEWIRRVRQFPPSAADTDNPAARLADFLETHYVRMSCGGLVLDTAHGREHSATLRSLGPVGRELVIRYVEGWKDIGFLRR